MGNKYFYEGAWMLAALIATLIALGFATNKVETAYRGEKLVNPKMFMDRKRERRKSFMLSASR